MEIEMCFNLAMRKSSRLITKFYEERLSTLGLKSGQFSILRAVNFKKQTSNKELQGILAIDQTTLSRNLKPLFRDGYLRLQADDNDARIKLISLTPQGETLYQSALPVWEKAQQDIVHKLGKTEVEKILTLSDSFVKALAGT
ncbi:MarR family winged helix-turn-helix transcriptional regulator [Thalassomonas sp. RHCl1]|uniref:MarR family winged helix-turn-helix transcriptional regulator n=1 Tax=Thalassomonas sp. RHCl1 TaxID=2995320 RepID=UPI00248C8FF9|nr:MarR family winged helix-turn-helix transcriptional regulator [Thalassomonas sp. RHCl1]